MDPIVIAGGGPACVHLLAEISEAERLITTNITIFDERPVPEGGSPHSDPAQAFRVNMRTVLHDIPGQPGFEEFLRRFGGAEYDPPRRWDLGRYNVFVAERAKARLRERGCTVTLVRSRAVGLERLAGGLAPLAGGRQWMVHGEGGHSANGLVVLATGNPPPSQPAGLKTTKPISIYTGDSRFASEILPSERVLVIGTGPGAIDVARYLIEDAGHQAPIALVSRSGMLSAVQTLAPVAEGMLLEVRAMVEEFESSTKPMGFVELKRWVGGLLRREAAPGDSERFLHELRHPCGPLEQLRRDIAEASLGGPAWRLALEAVGAFAPRLWRLIGPDEQARFLKQALRYRLYYCKRHAMQMGTALWLLDAMEQGKVSVGRAEVLPAHDRVVLATGPEYRVTRSDNPLLQQILAAGIAKPHCAPRDGFEIGGLSTSGLQLVGSPGVWVMGALARGEDFAIHGYPALAKHARIIAAQL